MKNGEIATLEMDRFYRDLRLQKEALSNRETRRKRVKDILSVSPKGTHVSGTVVDIDEYTAYVQLPNGEGFLPLNSEIPESMAVEVGMQIDFYVVVSEPRSGFQSI